MVRRQQKKVRVRNISSEELKEKRMTALLLVVFAGVFVYSVFQYDDFGTGQAIQEAPRTRVTLQPSSFGSGGPPSPPPAATPPPITVTPLNDTVNETGPLIPVKRVFVTNSTYDGDFGGYNGAWFSCFQSASDGGLPGTWVPWLSYLNGTDGTVTGALHAKDQIPDARYLRLDGVKVVDNKADLLDGSLDNPINVNEFGIQVLSSSVWTGTDASGMAKEEDCNTWETSNGTMTYLNGTVTEAKGVVGTTTPFFPPTWTDLYAVPCNFPRRLYCFEK